MENTAMNPKSSLPNHFVDIHEVLQEEDEDEEETATTTTITKPLEKPSSKPNTRPVMRKPSNYRSLGRQVSLETGFAHVRDDRERRALPRSGRSFGGFDYAAASRVNNKGDFSMFRTKSSLSKQNSLGPSRNIHNNNNNNNIKEIQSQDQGGSHGNDESLNKNVPAGRYFAALKGPELDQVKEYEDILLPKDETWPFLLRFPINCFGVCLGLSSQAVLWRALALSPATAFLRLGPIFNLVIWLLALSSLLTVSFVYALKCLFYFEAVKREYFHPVRVNFFFAPWVVCMFLAISVPSAISSVTGKLHPVVWCAFMGPYFFLELKIYGQWLSGGKRRLCMVANPSSHLSVVGNFVGAILAARVGWLEPAKFLWSVGFAHYLVLFVTLYQRLPTSEALPKELHPVYSMFIAAPSAASLAWHAIYEEFDGLSRTCYFIALFLYISLIVRLNFFIGFKFSLAWWSYTFPMTTASVATIKYAESVPSVISKGLAVSLSFGSSLMVCVLFVFTLLHIFIWQTLFPNDLAIAITERRKQHHQKDKKPLKQRWTAKHHANKEEGY